MILSNSAKCLKCNTEIWSTHVHDFRECSCGNIFVDGGTEYVRHGYEDRSAYQDLSIFVEEEVYNKCLESLEWCDKTGRNNTGRVCAIFRALRDTGFLNEK